MRRVGIRSKDSLGAVVCVEIRFEICTTSYPILLKWRHYYYPYPTCFSPQQNLTPESGGGLVSTLSGHGVIGFAVGGGDFDKLCG